MGDLNMFLPITKVDAVAREVWGVLCEEVRDKSGELFDYESSKPHFQKWNSDFQKATDGKSVGNLRSMHKSIAAGKFIAMDYDDANKCIVVGAKVVDDAEWQKVLEGVYTGFSVGGKYLKRWYDSKANATRYTAMPTEGSLVDNPCMYGATFKLIKAEGVEELMKFHGKDVTGVTEEQLARLEELRKADSLDETQQAELAELEKLAAKESDGDGAEDGGNQISTDDNSGDNQPDDDAGTQTPDGAGDSANTDDGEAKKFAELSDLEKFVTQDDLSKTVSEFGESLAKTVERFDSLQKAYDELSGSFSDLKKAYDEVKESNDKLKDANEALVKRVEALEKQPEQGGVVTMPVEKSFGGTPTGSGANVQQDKAELLRKMIAESSDLMTKQALSQELAMLEIKKAQMNPIKL